MQSGSGATEHAGSGATEHVAEEVGDMLQRALLKLVTKLKDNVYWDIRGSVADGDASQSAY